VPVRGRGAGADAIGAQTVLGAALLLPDPAHGHKSLYYATLLTELCKAAPTTVGPAVGKAIRRLFTMLENGLDSELSRRFAEWFALHMSNFNFQWVWKEWYVRLRREYGVGG
jgi:nuclear cap-binding protein subunit 1